MVLVWNYGLRVPEFGTPVENAQREGLVLRVKDAGAFFGSRSVRMRRWMVADGVGDAHALFVQGQPLDAQKTALQELDNGTFVIRDDQIDIGFAAPPSSVSLVELGAE